MKRGTTTITIKGEEEELIHLVADEGKVLTQNDGQYWNCVDTATPDVYYEIDNPEPEPEPTAEEQLEDAKNALEILGVNGDE